MQLRLNSASPSGDVRRETEDGVEYLVVPATVGREGIYEYQDQRDAYDREFVAGEEWADAAAGFEGVPAVADHPVTATEGTITPATTQTPGAKTTEVGEFRDPRMNADDTKLSGELWLREDERDAHGPAYEEAFDALENGEAWEVSPGYGVGRVNATSGTYDGREFDARQEQLDPDHVAIVLNGTARCDISQGCAAGVGRYNAEQEMAGVAAGTPLHRSETNDMSNDTTDDDSDVQSRTNALAEARTPEFDGTVSESDLEDRDPHESHAFWGLGEYLEAYEDETGETFEGDPYSALASIPEGAREWIAERTLLGNADATSTENLLLFNVVSPEGDLYETKLDGVLGQDGAEATLPQETRASAREEARQLLSDEFGREFSDDEISEGGEADDRENAGQRDTFRQQFREFLGIGDGERADSISEPDEVADTTGADSGSTTTETDDPQDTDMTDPDNPDDDQMIDYLAEETTFDRENAEKLRGEDCLGLTYERFRENAEAEAKAESDGGDGAEGGTETPAGAETTDSPDEPGSEGGNPETITMTEDEFDAKLEQKVDERLEERQNSASRERLTDRITANSEFSEDELDGMALDGLVRLAEREAGDGRANAGGEGSIPGVESSPMADMGAMQTEPVRANADLNADDDVDDAVPAGGSSAWKQRNGDGGEN